MAEFDDIIWRTLSGFINNDYGVAGAMGNMFAESGLKPNNLQNSYNQSFNMTDEEYTQAVDNGSYNEYKFVHDSAGYGLAQWTYYTRKQALYNKKVADNVSISNVNMQLSYLKDELESGYIAVLRGLQNATSVREASDIFLHDFENPGVQTEDVEIYRANLSQGYYDKYAGSSPPEPPEPSGDLYKEIKKTSYNTNRLSTEEEEILSKLSINGTCQIKFTFDRNKKEVGTDFFRKRLTLTNKRYNIIGVRNDGFVILQLQDSKLYSYLNPKYLREDTT